MKESSSKPPFSALSATFSPSAQSSSSSSISTGDLNSQRESTLMNRLPTFSIRGLFLIACIGVLMYARELFIPLTFSILAYLVLSPGVRWLHRRGIPRMLGALLILGSTFGTVGFSVVQLVPSATEWSQELPRAMAQVERKVRQFEASMGSVARTAERIDALADRSRSSTRSVELKQPSLVGSLLSSGGALLVSVFGTLVLLYFLLVYGDDMAAATALLIERRFGLRNVDLVAKQIQGTVSKFLIITTLLNIGVACLVATLLWSLGMPSPVLWGVMAGLLNFIPSGAEIVGTPIVALAALLTFDSAAQALTIALCYWAVLALEAVIAAPLVFGHQFRINPLLVFLWTIFLAWMWGIPGALMAVPLLSSIRIVLAAWNEPETVKLVVPQTIGTGSSTVEPPSPIILPREERVQNGQ